MDYQDYYFNNHRFLHEILIKTDNVMLNFVIDFAKMAIRGAFILNGSAAIAILGMFGNILLSHPQFGKDFYLMLAVLGIGAFCASGACCVAYFTQRKYQEVNAENLLEEITRTDTEMLKQQLKDKNIHLGKIEKEHLYQSIQENEKKEILSASQAKKLEKVGDRYCMVAITFIVVSYICFFMSLYHGYSTIKKISISKQIEISSSFPINNHRDFPLSIASSSDAHGQ